MMRRVHLVPPSQSLIGLRSNAHRPWSRNTLSMVTTMAFPIPVVQHNSNISSTLARHLLCDYSLAVEV